ncbi:MAG: hypothetical protein H7Z14_06910, partial [Anaerolineae bacterium]|nr:hypothetical protein [Phycisphaerae bacterium]
PATAPAAFAPRVAYDRLKDITTIETVLENMRIACTHPGRKMPGPCTQATITITYRPETAWSTAIFLLDGGKRFPVVLRASATTADTTWLRAVADSAGIEIALMNAKNARRELRLSMDDSARLKAFIDFVGFSHADIERRRAETVAQAAETRARDAARREADRRIAGVDPKDAKIVLIVDRSGSMMNHMHNVKSRVRSTLELLSGKQMFDVLAVSNESLEFSPDLVPRSDANVQKAFVWVAQLVTTGDDAALPDTFKQALDLKPELIVFFTDGDINVDSAQQAVNSFHETSARLNLVLFNSDPEKVGLKMIAELSKRSGGIVREASPVADE